MKSPNMQWKLGPVAMTLLLTASSWGAAAKTEPPPTAGERAALTKEGELAKNPELYLQFIRGIQQQHLYHAAIAHLDAFALRWPDNDQAMLLRAHATRELGRSDKARELYRALVGGDFSAEAYHGLGIVEMKAGRIEEAMDALNHAAALAPINVDVLSDQGEALMAAGRLEEAKQSLLRAAELDDRSKSVGANLARLQILEGKPQQAEETMRRFGIAPPMQQEIRQKATETVKKTP